MADTRLNIQLSAQNAELNAALKESADELKAFNSVMSDTVEGSNNFIIKYYAVKEAVDEGLDVVRLLKSSLVELSVVAGEGVIAFLEHAEAIARVSKSFVDLKGDLDKIDSTVRSNIDSLTQYINTLKDDPFIKAARNAQDYQARLAGLSGSARAAANELEYLYGISGKDTGGFSSDSLIEAGIALKSFRQDIEQTLPLAIKLAAGTGEPIEKAANTLGAAYNGLGTSFTTLQRTFHITREEIKQAGAALDENGEIASRTTSEYEKTRAAMEKIINTKFGDILGQKAETLSSAFQRVENALNNLFEDLGDTYSKSVTDILNGIGKMLEGAKSLVPAMKFVTENIYNFMTPVTASAKALVTLGGVATDTAVKIKEGWDKIPVGLQDTIKILGGVTAGFIRATSAVAGMVAASFVIGGLLKGLSSLSIVIAGLAKSVPIVATAMTWFGTRMAAAAAISFSLGKSVLLSMSLAGAAILGVVAAIGVYRSQVAYTAEEQKKYSEKVDHTVSSTENLRKSVSGTTQEILKSGASVSEMKLALDGYRASVEQAEIAYLNLKKAHDGKWWIFETESAKETSELNISIAKAEVARRKSVLKERNAAIKAAIDEQMKLEAKGGMFGEKLFDKAKALEDRDLKFQQDKAAGKIQTKRQEADELNKIYEESVKYRANLDREISVMESRRAINPEDTYNNQRLERFKTIQGSMMDLENRYRLERLSSSREAYREDINLAKEEMDFKISIGKATNAQKLSLIKEFMEKNSAALANDIDLQRQLSREVITLAMEEARVKKEIQMQSRQSSRTATEDRVAQMRYEDSIGKNRINNFKEENEIIKKLTLDQIKDIETQRDLNLTTVADENKRALIIQQAQDQIRHLREQEKVQLRENVQAHAEMTAQEIQDNIARINSRKAVLQAELELLEDRYGRGYDNSEEIKANRQIQHQKEVDMIKSEEKMRLEVERDERKIRTIKTETADKIKDVNIKYALETARFEESVQKRLAEKKLALNELVLKELETSRAAYEESVRSGKDSGVDALEREAEFVKRNTELKIASIRLERDAALAANRAPEEQAKIRREAANEEKKAQIESSRQLRDIRLREVSSASQAAEKELEESREVYEFKGNKSKELRLMLQDERKMIIEQLVARKATIKAQADEAASQASVVDAQRIQRNAQLEINKAIRDSTIALQSVNAKYATGNSELDKIVKKYEKALNNLRQMQGVLDSYDDEPLPEAPTPEEIKQNPGALGAYKDKVEDQKRKTERLRREKEKKEREERIREEMKTEAAAEAESILKRREELKKQGKSPQEIAETIREEAAQRKKDREAAAKAGGSAAGNPQNIPGTPVGGDGKTPAGQPGQVGGNRVEALLTQIRDGINKIASPPDPRTTKSGSQSLSFSEKMSQIPEGLSSS